VLKENQVITYHQRRYQSWAYIWAILSGIDDEPVEIGAAAVKEADISYSFLAGLMRQQITVGSTRTHL
jgi:hypothetical protein